MGALGRGELQQRQILYVDHISAGGGGDVIDNSDLPTDASASYGGHVIDNSTDLGNNGWQTYVATGDLDMNWDFNSRSGDLTISKFDKSITPGGLTFTGAMRLASLPPARISSAGRYRSPTKIYPRTYPILTA
jgi:hypothetical protein